MLPNISHFDGQNPYGTKGDDLRSTFDHYAAITGAHVPLDYHTGIAGNHDEYGADPYQFPTSCDPYKFVENVQVHKYMDPEPSLQFAKGDMREMRLRNHVSRREQYEWSKQKDGEFRRDTDQQMESDFYPSRHEEYRRNPGPRRKSNPRNRVRNFERGYNRDYKPDRSEPGHHHRLERIYNRKRPRDQEDGPLDFQIKRRRYLDKCPSSSYRRSVDPGFPALGGFA